MDKPKTTKYEQPKTERITLRLTRKALKWLRDNGGADFIEQAVRQQPKDLSWSQDSFPD